MWRIRKVSLKSGKKDVGKSEFWKFPGKDMELSDVHLFFLFTISFHFSNLSGPRQGKKLWSASDPVFPKMGNSVSFDCTVKRTVSGVGAHIARLDILSLSGGAPCPPVWEENSSVILMSPLSFGLRRGLMTLTLSVFLNLTPGGLPRCGFSKNSSRTGACGMVPKLSLLIPPFLTFVHPGWFFQTLDYHLLRSRVSWWGVDVLSCPVSEYVVGSGFWRLPVFISCESGYPVLFVTSGSSCCGWDTSG